MKTEIIKPNHSELKNIIQYFIIFKSESIKNIEYTTFPNTNLCLAIYKQNNVVVEQNGNSKHLFTLQGNAIYKSYLSGFHESNFKVSINASIDEICIIFHPAALRLFSNISYEELIKSDEAFQMLFPKFAGDFVESLFEENNNHKRILMLENIILRSINNQYITERTKEVLHIIQQNKDLKVGSLAKKLSMNESTLCRLFINQIGQNPKSFLRTVRFRKALDGILHLEKEKLTNIAYRNHYTDQSHFIRDFKEITGESPNQLRNKTSIQQEELAWIYSQH
ncbi:MAG: hypothetical protein DI529_01485 [Chryseobacterium sp.]|nr:MAG: hypothetical protein DI529_01485 [Chryseobacterium sp.]